MENSGWAGITEVSRTRSAIADTEREIFNEVMGQDEEDHPNYQNPEPDRELEQLEGWDGTPLSEAEIAASTISGTDEDRPLQHAEERGYEEQLEEARQAIAVRDAWLAEIAQRADPGLQQRIAQQKEDAVVSMIADPDRALALIGNQQQQMQALVLSRADKSMEHAHHIHGRRFEEAYSQLRALDPRNPQHCALVQSIVAHPVDPGEALMGWHGSLSRETKAALASSPKYGQAPPQFSRGRGLPSLNSQQRSGGGWPTVGNSGEPAEGDLSGDDSDIFAAASGR